MKSKYGFDDHSAWEKRASFGSGCATGTASRPWSRNQVEPQRATKASLSLVCASRVRFGSDSHVSATVPRVRTRSLASCGGFGCTGSPSSGAT